MSEDVLNQTHNRWGWKQWSIFGGIFFTFLVLIPAGLFVSPIWDEPLMDDAVLQLRPTPMPAEENAYEEVKAAMNHLVMPPEDQFDLFWSQPETYRQELQEWVQQNQLFFEGIFRAMALGGYQGKWLESADDLEKLNLFNASMALNFHALSFSDPLDRIRERVRQIELGMWVAQREYHILRIREFATIAEYAIHQIRNEFTKYPPSLEQLQVLLEELNRLPPVNEEYKIWMLRQMYQLNLDELEAGENTGAFATIEEDPFGPHQDATLDRLTFFYQPRRTRNLLFENYAFPLQQLDPDLIQDPLRTNKEIITTLEEADKGCWGLVAHFNRTGAIFLDDKLWAPMDMMASTRLGQELTLFKIQVALQLYRMNNGQFPKSLKELVPDYLKQNPIDPFTGREVSYLRGEKLLSCKVANQVMGPFFSDGDAFYQVNISEWSHAELVYDLLSP